MVWQRDGDDGDIDSILEDVYTHNKPVLTAVLGLFADAIYAAHSEDHMWRWMLTRSNNDLLRFSIGYRGAEGGQAKEAVVAHSRVDKQEEYYGKVQVPGELHFVVDRQVLDKYRKEIQQSYPSIIIKQWTTNTGRVLPERDTIFVPANEWRHLSAIRDITADARVTMIGKYTTGVVFNSQKQSHDIDVIQYMRKVLGDENIPNPDSFRSHALTADRPLQPSLFDTLSSNMRAVESGDTILRRSRKDIDAYHNEEAEGLPLEGRMTQVLVNRYERHLQNRAEAIRVHGTTCQVCDFVFADVYGERGEDYIEVHHKRPVSSYDGAIQIDPREDMAVVCANCHRMIHRDAEQPLSIESLRQIIAAHRAAIS